MSGIAHPPVAALNGELIPFADAKLPVFDLGVMQGATVTERMRTMRHQPYQVAEHLARLRDSLNAVGWHLPEDAGPTEDVIADVVRINTAPLSKDEDLAIVLFVTAGQSLGDSNGLIERSRSTVCIYTAPLPWAMWRRWQTEGVHLEIPEIRQLPADVVSPQIKHRSRLHWFLADQAARRTDPHAQALVLDEDGFLTETSSGNLFLVRDGRLLTPRQETTLPGIAQAQVIRLAERQGWTVERANLTAEDLISAEEAFLTSSTYCLMPVSKVAGRPIGKSVAGPITKMLIDLWSAEVGFSLPAQIESVSARMASQS